MTMVFADTSYYVALLSRRDRCHAAAIEFTAHYSGDLVTTAWVLTELGNFLSRGANRRAYVEFVNDLLDDAHVESPSLRWDCFSRA